MISSVLGIIGASLTIYSTLSLIALQIKPRRKIPIIDEEMEKLLIKNGYIKLDEWREDNANNKDSNNSNKDNSEK